MREVSKLQVLPHPARAYLDTHETEPDAVAQPRVLVVNVGLFPRDWVPFDEGAMRREFRHLDRSDDRGAGGRGAPGPGAPHKG